MELIILPLQEHSVQCGYFSDRLFTAEHFEAPQFRTGHLDVLLDRGFRHFGSYFFRPVCGGCSRCMPMRVPLRRYRLTKSARRLLNQNSDLDVRIGPPEIIEDAYPIYMEHKGRFGENWKEDIAGFYDAFFQPLPGARNMLFYDTGTLIGVCHFDETETNLSAVYTYYAEAHDHRSLGTYAIVRLLEFGLKRGMKYLYLGYYIEENAHMRYKARYYPNEISTTDCRWFPYMNENNTCVDPELPEEGYSVGSRLI